MGKINRISLKRKKKAERVGQRPKPSSGWTLSLRVEFCKMV